MKQMRTALKPYTPVSTFFALSSLELRKAKDERNYLTLGLSDKSGRINGYAWGDPQDTADRLSGVTFVFVEGTAKMHRDSLIISIDYIRPAGDEEIDVHDFFEVVPGGVDLWMERLQDNIELIRDMSCRTLVQAFFADPVFYEEFKMSPAGLTVHHNYAGGLTEHTVTTMLHAAHMSEKYPALLDRDLLLTGSFLHDIGKLREISGGMTKGYTTEGKLLGHISMGLLMLQEKLSAIRGFPTELGLLLKHMILSHHGELEFGIPVRPSTPEALALHHIENTDAKLNHLYCHLNDSPPENIWSSYDKFLSTEICRMRYKKELYVETQLQESATGGQCDRN